MSPDGKWLALASVLDRQQDLFLMRPDGTGLARLTDDAARDWSPRFTPDGPGLTFFSNQSGKYDAWLIRLDGRGRTRLTDIEPGVFFSMFAPDGKRLVVGLIPAGGMIGSAPWPMTLKSGTPLRGLEVPGSTVMPTHWSRGGGWLSGYVVNPAGEAVGFGLYDLAAGRSRQLNDDSRQYDLAWLPGNHRVVYFTNRGALVCRTWSRSRARRSRGVWPIPRTSSAASPPRPTAAPSTMGRSRRKRTSGW